MRYRLLACLLAAACAVPAQAGLFDDTEARNQINAMRSRLDETSGRVDAVTQNQVEFSNQVESIRTDIARLRGQIDELTYNLDAAQKRQKDFYIDLDNRLRKIESQAQAEQSQAETARAADETAMRDYEMALAALKASDYKSALNGFEAFMKNAPDSPQKPGAHFFAAYCYSHLKQPAKAAEMYRSFVEQWPNDERAPDAMLARADNMESLGQRKEARVVLASLAEKYPASEAGKQAKARLKKK